jgi:hypothetical protein
MGYPSGQHIEFAQFGFNVCEAWRAELICDD